MHDAAAGTSDRIDLPALYARAALGATFLAAVADRLGLWGPAGTTNVAWGDMEHFHAYAARLNPWFPASVIPLVGWLVTVAETVLGLSLIAGFQIRPVSLLSSALLLAFAIGMTAGTGVKSALNASVLSASACALLLWHGGPRRGGSIEVSRALRSCNAIRYAAAAWAMLFAAPHCGGRSVCRRGSRAGGRPRADDEHMVPVLRYRRSGLERPRGLRRSRPNPSLG